MMHHDYPVSIAPMMDRTDRHYHKMMRLISQKTLRIRNDYGQRILNGDRQRLLSFHPSEHPSLFKWGAMIPMNSYGGDC